ncbi:MAG: twin-arginine translocase TatA/TatE family subunit [Myxococcota bacterium]
MFGLGIWEIVLIAVVALLALGPERLPEAAKTISRAIRDFRRQTRELQASLEDDNEIGSAFRDIKSALRGDPVRDEMRKHQQQVSEAIRKAKQAGDEAGKEQTSSDDGSGPDETAAGDDQAGAESNSDASDADPASADSSSTGTGSSPMTVPMAGAIRPPMAGPYMPIIRPASNVVSKEKAPEPAAAAADDATPAGDTAEKPADEATDKAASSPESSKAHG